MLKKLATNAKAATTIEYAIMAGFLSIGVVGGLLILKISMGESYNNSAQKVGSAIDGATNKTSP